MARCCLCAIPGPTKDAYLVIAEGYAKLAELIERDKRDQM